VTAAPTELRERLSAVMLRDQRRLRRRFDDLRKRSDTTTREAARAELMADLEAAEQRVALRRAAVPPISFPDDLPITARIDDLAAAVRNHQVVVVAGETGSGKSTQLPKLCLTLGRGVLGMVGHTQPRRLAARTVAERVAEELGGEIGGPVGYTVRFTDRVGDGTLVKVMTDGILLAEIQRDRTLSAYDTIIVDEAHERSLNIDFLLGYLHQLLPRRPDLKVIITSATIDTERFSQHFGNAPVVVVSGRNYPVEVRYRPFAEHRDDERDLVQAICDAVDELGDEGPGDVLVFLSGEREIHDAADALRRLGRRDTEVLPLYARLSAAEQHRIFQPHRGRRIVLATNVAETSLTVPGVRYVVDAGTARISRYSRRLKVQRLPIEPVSQASANQRAGRCGRVAPGTCIRLYGEDDYASRPEYTEPEILRTNLASVILQMEALGFGDVAAFPFVEPPDARSVKDGVALLEELGALDPDASDPRKRLTPLGRRLAQLPIDPRLGRMVLEADRHGCVREVMVIAAALSIQDPRERPADAQQAAADAHRRFEHPDSDFLTYLQLWQYLRERQRALSSSQFRKLCRAEFLSYLRVREWQDLYSQLRQVANGIGIRAGTEASHPDLVHRSLLAGLLSQIGMRDGTGNEFRGARGARFLIGRGSVLARKPPRWVLVAELVETNRLWGRTAARIEPDWAEELAEHLVTRTYSDPAWNAERGAATVLERVTLYGLPIVAGRQVGYARVDPEAARELFVRHALVEGDWTTHHRFVAENRERIAQVLALEDRARRRDLLADDEVLYTFFDQRVGRDVTSGRHFDQWWKKALRNDPDLLTFPYELLVQPVAGTVRREDFPDRWQQQSRSFALSYVFDPGSADDGVTVHVPVALLDQVQPTGFDWHVPGMREELVGALIRTLPKQQRRELVPVREHVASFLQRAGPDDGALLDVLARELGRTGTPIAPADFAPHTLPDHLRITFQADGTDGRPIARSKDLPALQRRLREHTRAAVAAAAGGVEREGLTDWPGGTIPRALTGHRGGVEVTGYPALVDTGDTVALRVLTNERDQAQEMWAGTSRLLQLTLPSPRRALEAVLPKEARLAVARLDAGILPELLDDCTAAVTDHLLARHGGPAWDEEGFNALRSAVRADLADAVRDVGRCVGAILVAAAAVDRGLAGLTAVPVQPAEIDLRVQRARLVHPGFVRFTGLDHLADVERYLRAMARRMEKLPGDVARDTQRMRIVQELEATYERLLTSLPPARRTAEVAEVRWMLEELRVSLFAQVVGTAFPVSEQRVRRALDALG
jgi:ATP-dependent helicase HrpA